MRARSGSKVEKENGNWARHDRENDITHRSRLNYLLERATKITRQVEPYFTMSPAARLYRSACIPTVDIVFATTEKTCPAPIAVIHRRIKISSTPFHSLPKLKFKLFSRIINYARVFLLLLLLKSGWFQEYNLFYVSTISISSLMLIARYEVSYKITYLHNTIQFPYRGELKEKEKKTFRFLKYRLKITLSLAYPPCNFPPSNPINADANYAIPNNFVLETLCSGVEGFEGIIIGPKVANPLHNSTRGQGVPTLAKYLPAHGTVRNPW